MLIAVYIFLRRFRDGGGGHSNNFESYGDAITLKSSGANVFYSPFDLKIGMRTLRLNDERATGPGRLKTLKP